MWIMNIVMNIERPLSPSNSHVIPRMQPFFPLLARIRRFGRRFFYSHIKIPVCTRSHQLIHCFVNGWHTQREHRKTTAANNWRVFRVRPPAKILNLFTFLWCCVIFMHAARSILSTVEFEWTLRVPANWHDNEKYLTHEQFKQRCLAAIGQQTNKQQWNASPQNNKFRSNFPWNRFTWPTERERERK